MQNKMVWYASYGSNMNAERFYCYIQGGQPEGSTYSETGCRDKTLPTQVEPVTIPYPLYFSGESPRWGGGVAYIGHQNNTNQPTLGKMYLITEEQFIDVTRQENEGADIEIDFNQLKNYGKLKLLDSSYGTAMYLGREKDIPIYTFTANEDVDAFISSAPSDPYLRTIVKGLLDTYALTTEEICDYLIDKPLVDRVWTRKQLALLVQSIRND